MEVGWGGHACGWELVTKEATLGSTRLLQTMPAPGQMQSHHRSQARSQATQAKCSTYTVLGLQNQIKPSFTDHLFCSCAACRPPHPPTAPRAFLPFDFLLLIPCRPFLLPTPSALPLRLRFPSSANWHCCLFALQTPSPAPRLTSSRPHITSAADSAGTQRPMPTA